MAKTFIFGLRHSPRAFFAVNAVLLVIGIFLWWGELACLQAISTRIRPDAWGHFLSIYTISVAVGTLIVFAVMHFLAWLLNLHNKEYLDTLAPEQHRANFWSPVIVGYIELAMFPLAIVWGHAEFIGAWLVLKVAGQWVGWQGNDKNDPHNLSISRWRYNRFLVGNALNIIVAVAAYAIMKLAGVFAVA